jgi:hypothetical protein
MMKLWIAYLIGAIGTLAWKYWLYIRAAKKNGISIKAASGEWFFEKSAENAFSWLATIGIVWCVGVAYIDRVDLLLTGWLGNVPLHPAFALLLGSINEYIAPNTIKWIVGKFGSGQ